MDGGIPQLIRNLRKVQLLVPYHLLGGVNLHGGEEFNHPAALGIPEQLLQLGTPYQVILTDLINGELLIDMLLHIPYDPVIGIAACS